MSSPHRLAFRSLVRKYSCDICFTPMIVASDFLRSSKARDSEFTTNEREFPQGDTKFLTFHPCGLLAVYNFHCFRRWQASDCSVCCQGCPDAGWCSLCGCTFLRWSWPQLWLSPKVQLNALLKTFCCSVSLYCGITIMTIVKKVKCSISHALSPDFSLMPVTTVFW